MGFWALLLIAFLGTFLAGLFLSPFFLGFVKRTFSRFKKGTHISKRKKREINILEVLIRPLILINAIPHFPELVNTKQIHDMLLEIRDDAGKIKSKGLRDIKAKLISFSENADKLDDNMSPEEALNMMGRDSAIKIADEIREVITDIKKPKNK